MSLKKYKSQGKAVKVTGNSKEENSSDFVWISSKDSASGLLYRTYMYDKYLLEMQYMCADQKR